MGKAAFEDVFTLPLGTQEARIDTLLDLPHCKTDGHERFVEASKHILDNIIKLENEAIGIHLIGKPGTGKTFAAVALARAVYESTDEDSVFMKIDSPQISGNSVPFFRSHGGQYTSKSNNYPFDRGQGIGVGILDDAQGDERSRNWFFDSVDQLNINGGLLIVTSNETDPMFYMDQPETNKKVEEYLMEEYLNAHEVNMTTPVRDRVKSVEEQRIMSRINGSMLPIILETELDLRATGGFWKDF